MAKKFLIIASLLCLIAFAIPIEHKYDKLFRYFSLTLIPEGVNVSHHYEKKIYFYISDLIATLLLFLTLSRSSLNRFFFHPLWVVFFCALGSIIASPFHSYPVAYIRLWQLLTPILLFSVIRTAFSDEEREKVTRAILLMIVFAGLFQATIGILQYFQEGPLGLRLLGENSVMCLVDTPDGMRWTLDRIFHITQQSLTKIRAAGTFPHPNVFGGFLMLSIFSTYALFMRAKKQGLLLILPFLFFGMTLSYSRSALFGWALGSAIWFGLMRKEEKAKRLALTMALSVLLTGSLLYEQIISRGGIVNYNGTVQNADSVRIYHQNFALKIIEQAPLFGMGYNQFSERAADYFPDDASEEARKTAPHNIFLFLACETGLISLTGFLCFVIFLLYSALKNLITIESATFLATFIAFLFIGCCDFYPILFQQGKLMFFLTAGLLAAHTQTKLRPAYV